MSVTDELLENNEAYAASFDNGGPPMPPVKQVAVVACTDARLDPAKVLGLEEGDAHASSATRAALSATMPSGR